MSNGTNKAAPAAKGRAKPAIKRRRSEHAIAMQRLGEILDSLDKLSDHGQGVPYVGDIGVLIHNEGNSEDRAEGVLALLPIIERIRDRKEK